MTLRLIPAELMAEFRAAAATLDRKRSCAGPVAIIVIWLLAAAICARWL